jgi:hypothetical protein
MSSKSAQEQNLDLQRSTTDAINAYCRVLEVQNQAIAQGANPLAGGKVREIANLAAAGLLEELKLLHSLRNGLIEEGEGMGSPGRK